jgi:Acetyl-CoA acetyltransferase
MKEFGLTHEQLAYVAVAQRRWAAKNPRAAYRDPVTVEDVLASGSSPTRSTCWNAAWSPTGAGRWW